MGLDSSAKQADEFSRSANGQFASRHQAVAALYFLRMILSENRFTLFRIMR
jgi:hypothetical protein